MTSAILFAVTVGIETALGTSALMVVSQPVAASVIKTVYSLL